MAHRPLRVHARAQREQSTHDAARGRARTSIRVALLAAALAVLALSAWGTAPASAAETCKPFIFIGARGSGQGDAAGADGMGDVAGAVYNEVAAHLPDLEARPLRKADGYRAVPVYTSGDLEAIGAAALAGPAGSVNVTAVIGGKRYKSYKDSVADGERGLRKLLDTLVSECPTSQLLLAGYSQGAQVVQDVVQGLGDTVRSHIIGVAVFGDPRFNASGIGTTGTFDARRHGLLGSRPKPSVVATKSYCIAGDPVCQSFVYVGWSGLHPVVHGFDLGAHGRYSTDGWTNQAGKWLYERVRQYIGAHGGTAPPMPAPALRPLDLSLVVDTTGSMSSAIASVRDNLQAIHDELVAKTADFRLALTEFKDFGDPFQSQLDLDLTADSAAFSAAVGGLSASGGGDTPESVYSGLQTGLTGVSWRPDAAKAVVLVGDAPPHDPESNTNLTEPDIVSEALHVPAPIFALNICCASDTADTFAKLAADTSGQQLSPDNGAAVADSILEAIAAQSKTPVIGSSGGGAGGGGGGSFKRAGDQAHGAATENDSTIPIDTPVPFSAGNATSPLGEDLTYTWDFGDGTIVTAAPGQTVVTHAFHNAFSGAVKLTVTDADGRSAQALYDVNVQGDPVPAPAGLAAPKVSAGDGSVAVNWTPPSSGQATYYELQQDGRSVASVTTGQPLHAQLDGLTNGKPVALSVVAYDGYGRSVSSPAVKATPKAPVVPGRVVLWNLTGKPFSASAGGSRSAKVRARTTKLLTGNSLLRKVTVRAGKRRATVKMALGPIRTPVLAVTLKHNKLVVHRVATAMAGRLTVLSMVPGSLTVAAKGKPSHHLKLRHALAVAVKPRGTVAVRLGSRRLTLRAPAAAGAARVALVSGSAHGKLHARQLTIPAVAGG